MLKITTEFHKDLHTKHNTDKIIQRDLLSYVNNPISPTDGAFIDDPISLMQPRN